ncbi:hypothetical protein [Foetidibacter luteolus]|uniref:hypothetical protein n=1 Tax=Foetidibacter luteolus TaxID=2608880 RepID=UPI00129B678D|nr:hypothetical protein [Foetidibacter luteolus]
MNRKKRPLTQRKLAEFLLVSHGHISMHKSGTRGLPSAARERLARLEVALVKNDGIPSATAAKELQKITAKDKETLENECIEINYQIHLINRKLEKVIQKYEHASQVLHAIPAMLKNLAPGEIGEFEEKWLLVNESDQLKNWLLTVWALNSYCWYAKPDWKNSYQLYNHFYLPLQKKSIKEQSGKKRPGSG